VKNWQTVAILVLVLALAGSIGWALAERSARLNAASRHAAESDKLETRLAALEANRKTAEKNLRDLADSVGALEKWRDGAETRLAAAERKREGPALFRDMKRFVPHGGPGRFMALDGRRTQRFTVQNKDGNAVGVSLVGAADVGPEIAKWMGIDEAKRTKVNKLIKAENKRYAGQLAAKTGDAKGRGFNFGLGGGDDGWVDFVNGEKMKKLLNEEQRDKLLQKFLTRAKMHMVTAGPGVNMKRIMIHGLPGAAPEGKKPPAPEQPKEQF
jgi:hypothetical protein